MDLNKLQPLVISSFQVAGVALPGGSAMTDLFAWVRTKQHGPDQTIRLRLTPNTLESLVQSLSEAAGPHDENKIQRLFDHATVVAATTEGNQPVKGFLLRMEQKNTSNATALPVRLFLAEQQLVALADLLNHAVQQHGLRHPDTPTAAIQ